MKPILNTIMMAGGSAIVALPVPTDLKSGGSEGCKVVRLTPTLTKAD